MTEHNQNPAVTGDTEGHGRGNPADDVANPDSMDDVEGHTRRPAMDVGDEDDTQGHVRARGIPTDQDDEDDVEGHFRKPR